ncbi:MAG: hypothetical protein ACXABY_06685 [Candidatus Thorarchaeota archaeon]|jgi:hypothetical protein
MKKFTNNTNEVFNAVWAGETVVLNPGDAITVEDAIANKYAKDIAYATLLRARVEAEREAVAKGEKIKVLAVHKTELKKEMNKFLTNVAEDSMIERATEAPAKKKASKKEESTDKPSDEDFVE